MRCEWNDGVHVWVANGLEADAAPQAFVICALCLQSTIVRSRDLEALSNGARVIRPVTRADRSLEQLAVLPT